MTMCICKLYVHTAKLIKKTTPPSGGLYRSVFSHCYRQIRIRGTVIAMLMRIFPGGFHVKVTPVKTVISPCNPFQRRLFKCPKRRLFTLLEIIIHVYFPGKEKKIGFLITNCNFSPVFIGYGLKTGQGFYPGPIYFKAAAGFRLLSF